MAERPKNKRYQQKELKFMCITCKKTVNFVFLCRVTNGEKIEYSKGVTEQSNEVTRNRVTGKILKGSKMR